MALNRWESLKGTMTEQFDPILSLLGRYTRSFGSYKVRICPKLIFYEPVDPDGFVEVKHCWESLGGPLLNSLF